ncbi:hypothetical protein KQ693_05910 [Thermus sp. PS18]|uniref:hypothetical protein n=1 Tax=Thermus sp. PS18 TaxID=2849039 RepID=UPI0022647BBA|nr:hypothetical protein [Thermus sp. PS18]UZX16564.1 hypothetical protein KQ693_05910 [Thermus sp. PS18]
MTPHEAVRVLARDERLPYLALYPALVRQSRPNEVQVEPVGSWGEVVPPVGVWIPLAVGVPGVKATVRRDSLVLVGFQGGDPSAPYALVLHPAQVETLEIATQGSVSISVQGDVSISASGAVSVSGSTVSLG